MLLLNMPAQKKKIKGFGTHLQTKHFKVFKGKTKHELQNFLLSMSNQQLAVLDEVVNKAAAGKSLDSVHYPIYNIKEHAGIARKLKGHTHTQISLARRARTLPGSGIGTIVNATVKVAKTGAKVIVKGAKLTGKALKAGAKILAKGGKAAATWAMEHPQEVIRIGSVLVPIAMELAQAGPDEYSSEEDEKVPQRREAIDSLLADTSDEERDARHKKGSALVPVRQRRGGLSRWVI